ncbi:DUF6252 family protein [Luteirhabdus pelagi]|uniref:DUF6252 family protein n=1 Tax=Luteirhabdus pelagi TaxID=2792783 RepID=UPI001939913B|nr:DUF6252 family protein [Luteirhabdus pelagi]
MKQLLLAFFALSFLVGCEDVQVNDPGFQGNLNDELFKANDARVFPNEDGSALIQGYTDTETMTLRISGQGEGVYPIGSNNTNYATFENFEGFVYSTIPEGNGQIVVSRWDETNKIVSGSFRYTAYLPNIDTLAVSQGTFFEVPLVLEEEEENTNAGNFFAQVDGTPYNPFIVTAVQINDYIRIDGETASRNIQLRIPATITAGEYAIDGEEYQAFYTANETEEPALSGTFIILEHNPGQREIKGTFNFQTAFTDVTVGQFNVTYQ